MKEILVAIALLPVIASCTYVTARPSPIGRPEVEGIPFYGVRNYLIVRGTEVVSLSLPDCSQRYSLKIGSFLAKNHTKIDFTNGVIVKIDTDQDSTAAIVPLFDFAKSVITPPKPTGSTMSTQTGGTDSTNFGLFEVKCSGDTLELEPAIRKDQLMEVVPGQRVATPPESAPTSSSDDGADDGDPTPPAN